MRKWRVGTVSMGVMLIAAGLLLLLGELQGFNGAGIVLRWWPGILIILGIEIMVYIFLSHEEQPGIKFDGLSIFLIISIILVSSGIYTFNRFMDNGFSQRFLGEMGYYKNESLSSKSYNFDAGKVKKLQIDNTRGNIQIDRYDGSTIKVDTIINIRSNDPKFAQELADKLVTVTEGETLKLSTRNWGEADGGNNYRLAVNYEVKVPKELIFSIRNQSGEITLAGLSGDVYIEGRNGNILVRDIRGNVKIDNNTGQTEIEDVTGSVAVNNSQGNIQYSSNGSIARNVQLTCNTGSVVLELPDGQQGTFEVLTKEGNIEVDGLPKLVPVKQVSSRQEIKTTVGSASPVFKIIVDQGSVRLAGNPL